jgi:hypothetical protein
VIQLQDHTYTQASHCRNHSVTTARISARKRRIVDSDSDSDVDGTSPQQSSPRKLGSDIATNYDHPALNQTDLAIQLQAPAMAAALQVLLLYLQPTLATSEPC